MRSDSLDSAVEAPTQGGVVHRLLDPAFGFFVWAAHLLAIYIAQAVACVLGLGERSARVQSEFVAALVGITVLAAAIVVLHAVRRYRLEKTVRDRGFLIRIAVGHDAIATLAIVWQLFPLFLSPVCG
jgi:hypothetical protein